MQHKLYMWQQTSRWRQFRRNSVFSVKRCGNIFVLTWTVLLKAVISAYVAIWKILKHMNVYILFFVCCTKDHCLGGTVSQRPRASVAKQEWLRQCCCYLATNFSLLTSNEHICEVQNIAFDWVLVFNEIRIFGFFLTAI